MDIFHSVSITQRKQTPLLSVQRHTVCSHCTAVEMEIAGMWGQGEGQGEGQGGDKVKIGRGTWWRQGEGQGRRQGGEQGVGTGRGTGWGQGVGTRGNVAFSSRVFSNDILSHQHIEELLFLKHSSSLVEC